MAPVAPLLAGDQLEEYFASLNSFHADFTQTVVDSNGRELQQSQGTVWIQRPGNFRWDYRTPYRQQIVADGQRLWTFDEDLEQATVQQIDEALSSTPAMLLSSYRPLSEVMRWQAIEREDGQSWYRLDPRQEDASVEQVLIGFAGEQLSVIDVTDGFGNQTRIRFQTLHRNRPIDPKKFSLDLPPGTDIIGDVP